jgi:predicted phage terminase large subunit-like protein
MDFNIDLLPWQQEVWNADVRFNVIAAGRRTGKSRLAAYRMIYAALTKEKCDVFYIAPTQGQARDIMWALLMELTEDLRTGSNVNNLQVTLVNGSRISLKGSDRPDTMRGVALRFVVLDEYAEMKPEVWDEIILPALADHKGNAIFIGTPKGRNHFYETYSYAEQGGDPEYRAWHFTTYDNPYIDNAEIEAAKRRMSSHAFRQEFMASFEAVGSEVFNEDWVKFSNVSPERGEYYIACDLGGFEEAGKKRSRKKDNSAIAIVKVNEDGWYVQDFLVGRWTFDETVQHIFDVVYKYRPVALGIEKGIAQQAVMSPLKDMQRMRGFFFPITLLSHGNQNKVARIQAALQGRFEQGLITLNRGDWNVQFLDELFQFPDRLTHDDMVDALAYIDQLAIIPYGYETFTDEDDYEVLDDISGY